MGGSVRIEGGRCEERLVGERNFLMLLDSLDRRLALTLQQTQHVIVKQLSVRLTLIGSNRMEDLEE